MHSCTNTVTACTVSSTLIRCVLADRARGRVFVLVYIRKSNGKDDRRFFLEAFTKLWEID